MVVVKTLQEEPCGCPSGFFCWLNPKSFPEKEKAFVNLSVLSIGIRFEEVFLEGGCFVVCKNDSSVRGGQDKDAVLLIWFAGTGHNKQCILGSETGGIGWVELFESAYKMLTPYPKIKKSYKPLPATL